MEDEDMEETLEGAMMILHIAKLFYDHNRLEKLLDRLGADMELSWDNQYLVEESAFDLIFADTNSYVYEPKQRGRYDYIPERCSVVLRDPLFDRYIALCREYEQQKNIPKTENPYFRCLEDTLHHALQLEDYSYDYCWEDGTRDSKGPKIVLILYEEFDSYRELPESLFSILDFCETGIQHMEKELGISPVIPLEVPGPHDTKEAAK